MNDRIRLAEAMGWKRLDHTPDRWFNDAPEHRQEECRHTEYLPDPLTDANDDYAVLEWVRTDAIDWDAFVKALPTQNLWHFVQEYKIGDYARAALRVLDNE
jgi:hypothetical protein